MSASDPTSRARAIMVLGTTSHAGKTTVAAALCRSLHRKGIRVAPFKAQNMSLNSWVTLEGAEIGRAQALQARAARIEPHADMNPILLKPSGGHSMQVVALGKPIGTFTGREYYERKRDMRALAHAAYDRLAGRFDVVVLEGAGSPAEINLREEDLVNMSMAAHAGARCILVADIDRGGVFASILGTLTLLEERHRKLVAGVIINKFRGDATLLDPGIREIEAMTGVPILGVLPFLEDLELEEEDSLGIADSQAVGPMHVDIAVIHFPHLSNFTDFQPFQGRRGVGLRYVAKAQELGNPDFIILPGSKNVRKDAEFLRTTGLDRVLRAAAERAIPILGICGGFQILGRLIRDPHGIEGEPGETPGLGLLPVETALEREKELCRVEAANLGLPFLKAGVECHGYEIHMGKTWAVEAGRPLLRISRKNGIPFEESSGFASDSGLIAGCYLHGMFDRPSSLNGLLQWLCLRKGLEGDLLDRPDPAAPRPDALDRIADWLESRLDPQSLL
jgi:adenosylcobyric acid synthase